MTAAAGPPATDNLKDPDGPNGPLDWAFFYMLDWGTCPRGFPRFRILTTIARWYSTPRERGTAYRNAERNYGDDWDPISTRHQENVEDLVFAPVQIDTALHPGKFGLFLMRLHDGTLRYGYDEWRTRVPETDYERVRPGWWYCVRHWHTQFTTEIPFPWPFWLFPRGEHAA